MDDHHSEETSVRWDLADLRQPALTGLCMAGLEASWVWMAVVPVLETELPLARLFAPPLTIAVSLRIILYLACACFVELRRLSTL